MKESGGSSVFRFPAAWFHLTARERWALALILGLALIGLVVRYWHVKTESQEPPLIGTSPAKERAAAVAKP